MKPVTAVACYTPIRRLSPPSRPLAQSALVESLTLLRPSAAGVSVPGARTLLTDAPFSEETLGALLGSSHTPYLLFLPDCVPVDIGQPAMERMIGAARATGAGIVYADYYEGADRERRPHPLIDYSPGSVRDDFTFGPVLLISVEAARNAAGRHGCYPAQGSPAFMTCGSSCPSTTKSRTWPSRFTRSIRRLQAADPQASFSTTSIPATAHSRKK